MKQYIEAIKDHFVDYKGEVRNFILVAISQETDEFTVSDCDGFDLDSDITKTLSIGWSICSPKDEFDEDLGVKIATGRANVSEPVMYITDKGLLDTTTVRNILTRRAEHIKQSPGLYIKGYDEAAARCKKAKEMSELSDNFNNLQAEVCNELLADPTFLDNVKKYVKYINNCRKK